MSFLCLWPFCDYGFATIFIKSMHQENEFSDVRLAMHALCQSLQRDGALANVDLIKLTAFAIFSNFTFESNFATISNFTFANGFATINNFAFVMITKSDFHERSIRRKLFLVRKDMFQKQRIETNCFNCFA